MQPEFDERDAIVMRCAYAAQNTLGRLCDERVYENDLALRLSAEGFKAVHTQVPVTVKHDSFEKVYLNTNFRCFANTPRSDSDISSCNDCNSR
jgi:hypothetical protein